ncbi:MAG: hypothetical protein JRH06_09535 [Deltaproteobacteria bacterium]|nr:hypothetical protein [Deltaproteobacteria bacterium]MBW2137786.1 hypothetical protein [Deltaproteobacteria bacterium]
MENSRKARYLFRRMHLIFIALVATFLLSPCAHAHRVYLFAWVEGDIVHTVSYFSGNRPVKGGRVTVFDLQDKELLKGLTDEKGEFSFNLPAKKPLRIVIEEAMGHRTEYVLKAEDVGQASGCGEVGEKKAGPTELRHMEASSNQDQIRQVVGELLDARLKPIQRSMARMEKERGPDFRDVLGGLGYIFGLMGIILYLKGRRNGGRGKAP